MLQSHFTDDLLEAGCDEAGRGCLAGPVFAAAVILPKHYTHSLLNDSKQLSHRQREMLRTEVEREALAWAVSRVDAETIDRINILQASFLAIQQAVEKLSLKPGLLLIDGNRFQSTLDIPYQCVVRGDGRFFSMAAASVLAKTYRDDYMHQLHREFPQYGWNRNKGYPTPAHRDAIAGYGVTVHHRRSFSLQTRLNLIF